MSLVNEAGYLYVLSKKLTKLNKLILAVTDEAKHHQAKHTSESHPKKKEKHGRKHQKAMEKVQHLLKERSHLAQQLHHHYVAFAHVMQKEMKKGH